jgi:hypothetical protein
MVQVYRRVEGLEKARHNLSNNQSKSVWGVWSQVVERLPSKHEVLNSTFNPTQKKNHLPMSVHWPCVLASVLALAKEAHSNSMYRTGTVTAPTVPRLHLDSAVLGHLGKLPLGTPHVRSELWH